MKRNRKRWLWGLLLAALVFVAAYPVWLPWVLVASGRFVGVHIGGYSRMGYTRLVCRDVTWNSPVISVEARRASLPYLPWWLFRAPDSNASPSVTVEGWSVHINRVQAKQSKSPAPVASFASLVQSLRSSIIKVDHYLPVIRLTNGRVIVSGQTILLSETTWANLGLKILGSVARPVPTAFSVHLATPVDQPWEINFNLPSRQLALALALRPTDRGAALSGSLVWRGNRAPLSAEWSGDGWLPDSLRVDLSKWTIPGNLTGLANYEPLQLSGAFHWVDGRYAISLQGEAKPGKNVSEGQIPVRLDVQAAGDRRSLTVSSVDVAAPGMKASLSQPVILDYQAADLAQQAKFSLDVDLGKVPWKGVVGQLDGNCTVNTHRGKFPSVSWDFSGTGISGYGWTARRFSANGQFDWPIVTIGTLAADFTDGSHVDASGSADLQRKEIRNGKLSVRIGAPLIKAFSRGRLTADNVALTATVSGPFADLSHQGHLAVEKAHLPGWNVLGATLDWKGSGTSVSEATSIVSAGKGEFDLAGSGGWKDGALTVRVNAVNLKHGGGTLLASKAPFTVLWSKSGGLSAKSVSFSGKGRSLDGSVSLQSADRGSWTLKAEGLDGSLFDDFLADSPDWLTIRKLASSGSWNGGPVRGDLTFSMRVKSTSGDTIDGEGKIGLKSGKVTFDQVSFGSEQGPVLSVDGEVPVAVVPGSREPFRVGWADAMRLKVQSVPNEDFWKRVAGLTGLTFDSPHIAANLKGTLQAPDGTVSMKVAKLHYQARKNAPKYPAITDVNLSATASGSQLELKQGDFKLAGQPVTLHGNLPLGAAPLRNWFQSKKLPDWRQASLHLDLDKADLAPFARYAPSILADRGTLDLHLALAPGAKLTGTISVANAATRPLFSLGSIQDLSGRVEFAGRTLTIERFTGDLAGQTITLKGGLNWDEAGKLAYHFGVIGQRIPLFREPGLIVRSDVDLKIDGTTPSDTTISGKLGLQNSLYVSDLQSLVPTGVETPSRRPPYFSVAAKPFANWKLNVALSGDHFLRIENPLFKGTISANFTLGGTLQAPVSLGEAKVDSGTIIFPFSTMDINSGRVSLSQDNPYMPRISVQAGSRSFGYDVSMRVTGPVDKPQVVFSSNPPLSSASILLLLTTGAIPDHEGFFTTQQRATRLAFFIGKGLLAEFGPDSAGSDRLTIRSGEGISQQGKETYQIEYKLGKDWSLVGEYDEFDDFNGGLKWRIYSK